MSTAMTAAGESLVARLQAEGKPLIIDRMIFAHIPGQDHTQPISPGVTVPADPPNPLGEVKHTFTIPPEYRGYVNPNQVVYSALLGSDVGDFTFNWQSLYCAEHDVLVAVATFPALEKRKYDVATGKTGNNLTRNFLLTFTGAREITGLTISADVWQLDFTVRLKGMDERTRLANFDLYGQGYFEGSGWLLTENAGSYSFTPGLGYVGGIRAMLNDILPLPVGSNTVLPQNVWLSVCLKHVGSDRMAEASPMLVDVEQHVGDAEDETGLVHYRQIVARIEADGSVTDLRPRRMQGLPPDKIGAASRDVEIIAGAGIAGGGMLTGNITVAAEFLWSPAKNYPAPFLVFGNDANIYKAVQPSGPDTAAGMQEPGKAGSEAYWTDYAGSIVPPPPPAPVGIIPAGYIAFLPFRYNQLPALWYFCNGTRHANSSPQGIVLNALPSTLKSDWGISNNGSTINVPNWFHGSRGPIMRAVDGSSRQVGSVEDDAMRQLTGTLQMLNGTWPVGFSQASGVFYGSNYVNNGGVNNDNRHGGSYNLAQLDNSRYTATASENRMLNRGMTPAIFLGA